MTSNSTQKDTTHHGMPVASAEFEVLESRRELNESLDHLRDSLENVEGQVEEVRKFGKTAVKRLRTTLAESFREALHEIDQNALASWFVVFLTGCAFGILLGSSRSRVETQSSTQAPNDIPERMADSAADLPKESDDEDVTRAA
jgi:hypothetical protein